MEWPVFKVKEVLMLLFSPLVETKRKTVHH